MLVNCECLGCQCYTKKKCNVRRKIICTNRPSGLSNTRWTKRSDTWTSKVTKIVPYPMTRTTSYIPYIYIIRTSSNGYTVITCVKGILWLKRNLIGITKINCKRMNSRQVLEKITVGNNWIIYFYIVGVLYVNSISVGTSRRRLYEEWIDVHSVAAIEPEMELGTVLNFKPLYCQIGAHKEPYSL